MNPSITPGPLTYRGDPSWPTVAMLYGGQPRRTTTTTQTPTFPKPPTPNEPGDDDMPWELILNVVLELVRNCEPRAATEQLRRPSGLSRLRLERNIRQTLGIRPREWRHQRNAIMPAVMETADKLTEADAAELVAMAHGDEFANLIEQ